MTVKINIADDATGLKATVENDGGKEEKALVVSTRPLKNYINKPSFFISTDYGINMNINTGASGTTVGVHNGTDTAYWTASDIVGGGKSDFVNTDRPQNGSNAIEIDNAPVNDEWQFDKGSDLDASGYASIQLSINVDKDWKAGDSISLYGWDTDTGLQVGSKVYLENYFEWGIFDTYHTLKINLDDMGDLASYTTLDALRMKIESSEGKSPKFYIDDMWFNETGPPVEYRIEPDKGTWLHIQSIKISMADVMSGIVTVAGNTENATLPALSYNKILGESALGTGITFHKWSLGEVDLIGTVKQLSDFLQFPGSVISSYGSDGTNSWMNIKFEMPVPWILKSEDKEYMTMTVNDDLSGLLLLRMAAGCFEETR